MTKVCASCSEEKPLSDFFKIKDGRYTRRSCRECRMFVSTIFYTTLAHRINRDFNGSLSKGFLRTLMENQDRKCSLSGIPFKAGRQIDATYCYSPSLDRVDPFGGYVEGNVRFILNSLNAMKSRGSDEDVLSICRAVVQRNPL